LLHTSQEKADRWFGGGRFWQTPGAFLEKVETVVAAAGRCLGELGFSVSALWVVEHVYPIYNRGARLGAPESRRGIAAQRRRP
jgi:hypothetical protein